MDRTRQSASQAQWFVRTGREAAEGGRAVGLPERLSRLQTSYGAHPTGLLWGRGDGCLDVLWLAEQYDVQLLVLEGWPAAGADRRMARACRRNLFAVVCPTIVLPEPGARLPALPNARTYAAADRQELRAITGALLRETKMARARP